MSNVIPFPRMPRASHPAGIRTVAPSLVVAARATDKAGHAPLVLLVDHDANTAARCEAILAKLHFAVAPTRAIEEARKVMESLRPNHRRSVVGSRRAAAGQRRRSASRDSERKDGPGNTHPGNTARAARAPQGRVNATVPPFITKRTRRSAPISCTGLPSTAIRSANSPGCTLPMLDS